MLGYPKMFDIDRAFGFIRGEDGVDYFVHAKDIVPDVNGYQVLYEGDTVCFEEIPNRGRCRSRDRSARVTEIIDPPREAVPHAPDDEGPVEYIGPGDGYGFAKWWRACSSVFIDGDIVQELNLKVGDWISYVPRQTCKPPKHKNPNKHHALWRATHVRRIESPKHAGETVAAVQLSMKVEANEHSQN